MPNDLPRSPTALAQFLGCEHRTHLEILDRRGALDAERRPPRMGLLAAQGDRHEQAVLEELQQQFDVVDLTGQSPEATIEAMRAGREVIAQGTLASGDWTGRPDFLIRVNEPSPALGAWSYEAHDAKMATSPRPAHVFQLLFYTDEIERIQGRRPARMHLMLGTGERPSFHPDDFAAYAAVVRDGFTRRAHELADGAVPAYPYPVPDCAFCPWWHVCDHRRREDDHVSLVANLQRGQGLKLEASGVPSLPALAVRKERVPRLSEPTLATLRAQADLQLRSRGRDRPLYELLEPEHDRGLHRLPAASAGDVHLDFEGDPYWGDEGLEYLLGWACEDEGYQALWSHSRADEKVAVETWIDWLMARLDRHPGLHVYHYNHYEPTALKKLVARHATRELELDELLRRKVFVDLYGITRQAVRAGVESYGLKAIETVVGFERDESLDGIGSLRRWQEYGETGEDRLLREIEIYNSDDCHSTVALCDWLRERRPEAEAKFGVVIDELAAEPLRPPTDAQLARRTRTEALRPRLVGDLPDDESDDTAEQRARRIAFLLTGYHEREAKPGWWEFFARREKSLDELKDEDGDAVGRLEFVSVEDVGRSYQWTLRYPEQDHKIGPGKGDEPLRELGINVVAVDDACRTIIARRGKNSGSDPPLAIAPGGPYSTEAQIDSLFSFGEHVADAGLGGADARTDLLLARAPRFRSGTPALTDGPIELDRLAEQVGGLDQSALVVQGPPGTGKTWTAARVALRLMAAGQRVGVTATSHKAINNLLRAMDEAADEENRDFRGWRKTTDDEDNCYESDRVTCSGAPDPADMLHAGTAWYWSRDDADPVDVLLVDEAGQVALADAIAVARNASSLVLFGDPQQLAHVSQGTHALGSGASVLEHLLGDHDTVPPDRGVFLDMSWRLDPDLCDFVSRTMYDGRLSHEPGCELQHVESSGLAGTGVRMIPVEHEDNRGRSEEEAEAVAAEIRRLLADGWYTDRDGNRRRLGPNDILVVAPYNAQVRCLRARLPEGVQVGTVDKFQGQEAPVVFFSMATSTGEDASRGMSFLFSRNRLNVALSRAQALAVVVCSPSLLRANCATVADMRLVNLLCQVREAATG